MKLDDINKEQFFKVPDNYFEEFPERLKKRLHREKVKNRSVPIHVKIAIAASITIFIMIAVYLFIPENRTPEQMLADIPTEDLIVYLEESELTAEEIIETIDIRLFTDEGYLDETIFFPEEEMNEKAIEEMIDEYELELQIL